MLSKKNRAGTKEVEMVFKQGRSLGSPSLSFRYVLSRGRESKISFVAPKSVAKLAVKRNLLRRRGYHALQKIVKNFPPGITGVFVFKKYVEDVSMLEHEIKNLCSKIN